MKDKKELLDELGGLSPLLFQIKKEEKEPFSAPKGYFSQLPDEVLRELRPASPRTPQWREYLELVFHYFSRPGYAWAVAGMGAIVVAVVLLWPSAPAPTTAQASLDDIPDEALQAYVSAQIHNFDRDLVLETLLEDKEETPSSAVPLPLNPNIVNEYLDSIIEDVDLKDIEEML